MATSSWVRQPRRFRAVRRSASSWPMSWPAAIPGRPSISSTSLPPACMWPMSTVWSRCWISSLMRAIRSSSLSTISTSSNAPTISSTSAPRAAAAAAPSSPPAPGGGRAEPALLHGAVSPACAGARRGAAITEITQTALLREGRFAITAYLSARHWGLHHRAFCGIIPSYRL